MLEHNGLTLEPEKFLNPLTVISFLCLFFFCAFCEGVGKGLRIAHDAELRLPVIKKFSDFLRISWARLKLEPSNHSTRLRNDFKTISKVFLNPWVNMPFNIIPNTRPFKIHPLFKEN